MADSLSVGALRAIYDDTPESASHQTPLLQVLQVKELNSSGPTAPKRFRLVLSDSVNFVQSMAATQLNDQVAAIQRGMFVRLNQFTCNTMKDRKIFIVLGLEIMEELGIQEKIGNPQPLNETTAQPAAPQQPPTSNATTFYGNKPAQPQAAPRRPPAYNNIPQGQPPNGPIYPIEGLSPYQNKWTIRARVAHKSEIKHYHNQRGEGKLFSCTFLDETGEIRATGFNDAVDQLYELLQEGSVYMVSKCRVNIAKKQFSNVNNEYELTFERDTEVVKCDDADAIVPQLRFSFVELGRLQEVEKDSVCDVIGIVKDIGDVSEMTSKTTNKPFSKREITLVDASNYSVRVTLWGNTAATFNAPLESVLAFKGVKVSDFGGRSLSMNGPATMNLNPDIPEAHQLKGWYDSQGRTISFSSHANSSSLGAATGRSKDPLKTLAQIKDENIGMGEVPEYFSAKATIVFIKQENVSYPACQSPDCNKKVLEDTEGQWRCEKCDKSWPAPQWRYIMTLSVNDHTGQAWFSTFDDVGHQILGITATDLHNMKEEDEIRAGEVFSEANCRTWIFRCRAKQDNFGGQVRMRYSVMNATPVDYRAGAKELMDVIKSYGA
ncbi:Replication factor A protein 1 [Saitoella coloradoensis]